MDRGVTDYFDLMNKLEERSDFESFGQIKRLSKIEMVITQKIHGTNAQIFIEAHEDCFDERSYSIKAGSRTRWVYPGDDNYGFAAWVEANKDELIRCLGVGRHYGEGLAKKTLCLFNHGRYNELPPDCVMVPVLYRGPLDLGMVPIVMNRLKEEGSALSPGFMRPEGVVTQFAGHRYKSVFDAEETQWKKPDKEKCHVPRGTNFDHLMQPIRLEKLLSRDESYVREFPNSLPTIVKEYVADLIKEGEISGDSDQIKAVTKGASREIFAFVRTVMRANYV